MNCLFCQQPVELRYQSTYGVTEESTTLSHCYVCDPCNTTYFLHKDKLGSYYIEYQQYKAWFYFDICGKGPGYFTLVKDTPAWDHRIVLRLDFFPTLTPQNIAIRLPTLLTFL